MDPAPEDDMRTAALRSQPGNGSAVGVNLYRFLGAFALVTLVALPASAQVPPDSVILRMVRDRIESGNGVGAVVGVVAADGGTRVIAWQKPDVAGPRLDRSTVFEIGSITKVFTTITLAEMAERGEVRLDDPVQKFLPPDVRMPMRGNDTIRLGHIARQNSGLPRLPNNLAPGNRLDPYADYTVASLYAFLDGYTPIRAPGSQYEYSNLAMGLLGHVLAASHSAGMLRTAVAPRSSGTTAEPAAIAPLSP